jgi:5'-deoxynucleotidase YfbR-like HD superfamily hydrolase
MKIETESLLKPFPFKSRDDMLFVAEMCEKFDRVCQGFERFVHVNPVNWLHEGVAAVHEQLRTGYARRGVPLDDVQTVAQHMASGMKLAFLLASSPEEASHVSKMFATHDLGEGWTGDFTPDDPVTKPEKYRLEKIIIELMVSAYPVQSVREEIPALWDEFGKQKTSASHLGNDIDRNEMMMQVQVYEDRYPPLVGTFSGMWHESPSRLKTPKGREFFAELLQNHPAVHPLKTSGPDIYTFPWTL